MMEITLTKETQKDMENGYLCLETHNCLCNLALNELPLYVSWKDKDLYIEVVMKILLSS